jgi:NTE family protein
MPTFDLTESAREPGAPPRIGLALSGGGFRAAIFHLGVIRRLEELGLMPYVSVISAVSGGSIIAAYYVCEMERRLRKYGPAEWRDPAVRVALFEEIAAGFLAQLDQNLRTRALLYGAFHYPWTSIKSGVRNLVRAGSRSELIQREYDRCFYDHGTLGDLPSVTPERAKAPEHVLYGPKVIFNTTSVLTGMRVPFSRVTVSGMNQLSCVNTNVLPLARVVGASSAVPVLFPPTMISGDVLVDGGVSDNQGIEALLEDEPCDVLLVSDASGQMETLDTIKKDEVAVALRVNSILQFQLRQKLLERLLHSGRRFAFVHLYLNLKDRGEIARVPSEFIPALARLRTDLDQFSFVEREMLMYHGYTLIDAQIQRYCADMVQNPAPLREAPLIAERARPHREAMRNELEAGADGLYLLRCARKFGAPAKAVLAAGGAFSVALFVALVWWRVPLDALRRSIQGAVLALLPNLVMKWIDWLLARLSLPRLTDTLAGLSAFLAVVALLALCLYLTSYPVFRLMQVYAMRRDLRRYFDYTGMAPSTRWPESGSGRPESGNRAAAD